MQYNYDIVRINTVIEIAINIVIVFLKNYVSYYRYFVIFIGWESIYLEMLINLDLSK